MEKISENEYREQLKSANKDFRTMLPIILVVGTIFMAGVIFLGTRRTTDPLGFAIFGFPTYVVIAYASVVAFIPILAYLARNAKSFPAALEEKITRKRDFKESMKILAIVVIGILVMDIALYVAKFDAIKIANLSGFAFSLGTMIVGGYFAKLRAQRELRKGKEFLNEFLIAGASLGPLNLGITWQSTLSSGGSFVGYPGWTYLSGFPITLEQIGIVFATPIAFYLVGTRINAIGKRIKALTIVDLDVQRYESDVAIRLIDVVIIFISYLFYNIAQYTAISRVIEVATGLPFWSVVIISGTIVMLYCIAGGLRADAYTDFIQTLFMAIGPWIILIPALIYVGGMGNVTASLIQANPALIFLPGTKPYMREPATVFSFIFLWSYLAAVQPTLVTRYLSCRDQDTIKKGAVYAAIVSVAWYIPLPLLGLIGRAISPDTTKLVADQVVPLMITMLLPTLVAGFILTTPFAGAMSTSDSISIVNASLVSKDVVLRSLQSKAVQSRWPDVEKRRFAIPLMSLILGRSLIEMSFRASIIVVIIFTMYGAITEIPVIMEMVTFGTSALTAALSTFILGNKWKRATKWGAIVARITGFAWITLAYAKSIHPLLPKEIIYFILDPLGLRLGFLPFVWAVCASYIAFIAVSLLTKPPSKQTRELFFGKSP